MIHLVWISMILAIPQSIFKGYVLSKLWLWFIVPTFGIAELPIAASIGIGFIVGMLTSKVPDPEENEDADLSSMIDRCIHAQFYIFTITLLTLISGWVASLWMPLP